MTIFTSMEDIKELSEQSTAPRTAGTPTNRTAHQVRPSSGAGVGTSVLAARLGRQHQYPIIETDQQRNVPCQTAANHLPFLPLSTYYVQRADGCSAPAFAEASAQLVSAADADHSTLILHPHHIVQTTGVFGKQNNFDIAGANRFTDPIDLRG